MKFRTYIKEWYTKIPKEATHLLMDGGMIKVPCDKLSNFYKYYYKQAKVEDIFLIEKLSKSSQYKFFLDIDLKKSTYDYKIVLSTLQQLNIFEIFECNDKCGIHAISNIEVNYNTVKHEFTKTINQLKEINNEIKWDEIVDDSVYKIGLRMVLSKKKEKGNTIDRCYGKTCSYKDFLKSILCTGTSHDNIEYERENEYICQPIEVPHKTINKYMAEISPKYLFIDTKAIKLNEHVIFNTKCKFCTNMNASHNSCTIYFVLNKQRKLYQKCRCPCNTVKNRTCLCKNYKSQSVNVPYQLCQDIFETV